MINYEITQNNKIIRVFSKENDEAAARVFAYHLAAFGTGELRESETGRLVASGEFVPAK